MAKDTFAAALRTVLVFEGGKVDDPQDPGGRTNQGVIQRVYSAFRRGKGLAPRDVYQMEPAERDEIYRRQYWAAISGDELPAGIDLVVFDAAVNSGPGQAIRWLQRALGAPVDGHFGTTTIDALAACQDDDALVAAICARRMAFLRELRTFSRFGRGWTSRVDQVRRAGQALASGSVGKPPVFAEGGYRKALLLDAKPGPMRGPADATAGGGIVATTISQVTSALTPLSDYSDRIKFVLAIVTAIGVVVAAAGVVYGRWARGRAARRAEALDLAPPAAAAEPPPAPAADPAPVSGEAA